MKENIRIRSSFAAQDKAQLRLSVTVKVERIINQRRRKQAETGAV